MTKKIFITIGVIAVVAIGVIVWWNKTGKQQETVKIGVIIPLTGNAASQGQDVQKGMNMAFVDFMSSIDSTLFKVKLIVEDNFSTTKSSIAALEKLIQIEKPSIVLGPLTTSDMLSMIPIAEKNKTILFSPSVSSPKVSNAGKYIFRMGPLAPDQSKVITQYVANELKLKRVGILYMNDDSGNSHMEVFVPNFTVLGGEIVFNESFERNDIDFKSHLLKLKSLNAEALFIAGTPKTTGLILKQAKELNLDIKFVSSTGAEGYDCIEIAQNAAENIVYTSVAIDSVFIAKFRKKYNNQFPSLGVVLGYDAMAMTLKLLYENSNDTEQLREALSHLEFSGVTGKTVMSASGDARKDIALKTVKNGEFIFLK
ncbi:MAG: penicillin-binding protein activator [Bacteroidales bacterium]|jgi:branched-chain amino acid transport system substrate-binding protein|nr:penicillin-binding protein activator [Bacteroidales bacterium]